ncbi:hypothetical protein N9276_02000 [Rhodopirellula sp.]|nr:hypothetical protein [Rhodopirellula sp.]
MPNWSVGFIGELSVKLHAARSKPAPVAYRLLRQNDDSNEAPLPNPKCCQIRNVAKSEIAADQFAVIDPDK